MASFRRLWWPADGFRPLVFTTTDTTMLALSLPFEADCALNREIVSLRLLSSQLIPFECQFIVLLTTRCLRSLDRIKNGVLMHK